MTVTREPALANTGQLTNGRGAVQATAPWPAAQQTVQPGVAACWLCGTRLSTALMVADGGPACRDVHWYCQDVPRCTWRWTTKDGSAADRPAPGRPASSIG